MTDVKLPKNVKTTENKICMDTESHNPLTHSTKVCEQCSHCRSHSKEQTVPQHLLTTFSDRVTSSRFLWQIFDENVDEDSSSVWSHCKEQNKGGRQQQQQQNKTAKREERREMYEMM